MKQPPGTVPAAFLTVVAVMMLMVGCSGPTPTSTTVRVASLKGPTTMGLVKLMDDADQGRAAQDYQVTVHGSPDQVVPLLVQGKVDVALLPANLAAVLYQQTATDAGPTVQVAAVNTLGVLQVVENGDTVRTWADLAGRTIVTTGKGTTPEYVLDYLLARHGLDPDRDVTVVFESEATALASRVAAEPGIVAVLPQPYVTVVERQSPTVRTVLDLTDEWDKVADDGSQLVTGVLVVRTAFAQAHPQALAGFLADYRASTQYTNDDPAGAAALIAAAGIVPDAAVAQAAIPHCHIVYLDGEAMVTALGGYLQVLFTADPRSVGGSLPGDDFYRV
ncbi:MAG: ABC transporter substrate-binding protein [Cellulomonas sp.]|jgi:NitT/TauT family transport system substrate-binding protein|nr:ABC transporter substrate-binding protein [Cellulomonas sp.]